MGLIEKDGKKEYILDDTQKLMVRENYDKIKLKELAQKVCDNPNETGQTYGGLAIRKYIASEEFQGAMPGARVKTTKYVRGDNEKVELDEDQKEFVRNNIRSIKWLEMAQILFANERLTPLNGEARAVYDYCLTVDSKSIPDDELQASEKYEPPTSIDRLVTRVNKYRFKFVGDKSKLLDKANLKQNELKNLECLLGYMRVLRFTQQASKYQTVEDRELFESLFVRYCYDKPDLLEEEVDNYVAMCAEAVTVTQLEKTVQLLRTKLNQSLEGNDDAKAMTKTFAELIDGQSDKLNQAKKNYAALSEKLVGARSKRIENKIQQTASLYNLVEMWKKEEDRKKIIAMAMKRQLALKEEVDRLSNIDSLRAEIFGLDEKVINL